MSAKSGPCRIHTLLKIQDFENAGSKADSFGKTAILDIPILLK